jgi:hypothetical protein
MKRNVTQTALRYGAVGLSALFLLGVEAHAQAKMLTKAEINTMMSGNSVEGAFPDGVTLYRQNNHADGTAVVVVKDDKIRNIPWTAVEADGVGNYCEDWSADDWGTLCFTVTREDTLHPIFTNERGELIPTTWIKGFIDLNHK